jgi:4-amino-4-deoxy-L-arabinose transferase-like glycosyltransferase
LHIPAILNFYSNDGSNNAYLLFSRSLLKGHLSLPPMDSYQDMILYHGQYYLPYPPFPSLILLPFVALFGSVNTVFIVVIMSWLNLYLLCQILRRLEVKQEYFPWLITAFFFGTAYWFALFTSHHVYSFAQICSCSLQLLLIAELLGKRRWWLIGLCIGCSFLTRQFTIFYIFFALGYMLYLHRQQRSAVKITDLVSLFTPVAFCVAIYLFYNYLRFGNPLDPGYAYIIFNGELRDRVGLYGVFSVHYLFFNLYSFLIKGFDIEFTGPGLIHIKDMDLWGTSLLSASPFLIASIKAAWPSLLKIGSWLTIGCILAGALFYHNNGFHQINAMRFSLDFLPLLFVLTAAGIKSLPDWLLKGMVLYALALNVLSFAVHFLYQAK